MVKSPIYGAGRNRKHRPKKSPLHASAANVKMRGKKSKLQSCGCCVCLDLRDKVLKEEYKREAIDWLIDK